MEKPYDATASLPGLTTGMKHAFRIDPDDLESPWSDQAGCLAP